MEIKLPERPEQHPTPQDDGRAEAVNRHLAGLRHSAARIQGSIEVETPQNLALDKLTRVCGLGHQVESRCVYGLERQTAGPH